MSPELRVEVTFLMTFSSVNPVKIGDVLHLGVASPWGFLDCVDEDFCSQHWVCQASGRARAQAMRTQLNTFGHKGNDDQSPNSCCSHLYRRHTPSLVPAGAHTSCSV